MNIAQEALPGAHLDADRMPGHWLLARMGKRVLRPGGVELTQTMLSALQISTSDHVVELAPGLGATTRLVLARSPKSYVGIERDEAATRAIQSLLRAGDRCSRGLASDTGLAPSSASVVFAEAMLTMQTDEQKRRIVAEVHRILSPGGRYGIHELALLPDLAHGEKEEIQRALSDVIHIGARPLALDEWTELLKEGGFEVSRSATAPMLLLEPARMLADEGVAQTMRIAFNVLRAPAARKRVMAMRSVFRKYASKMCAISIVARKLDTQGA